MNGRHASDLVIGNRLGRERRPAGKSCECAGSCAGVCGVRQAGAYV